MLIEPDKIKSLNAKVLDTHQKEFDHLRFQIEEKGLDYEAIVEKLKKFQIAIPSWALGAGGTRFGRFSGGGEPRDLKEKIEDVGTLNQLTRSCSRISLHIPWDIPSNQNEIKELSRKHGISFDAVNSNTFQDQENQQYSYKYGSLSHTDRDVREQAIQHNKEVIKQGIGLGSKALTVWLADGSSFPGQQHFKTALKNTIDSLHEIYDHLPGEWNIFVEYKPFEPNFYSMVIPDWGTSHLIANELGRKAKCLVDLGHHLPNTNIEQIVAILCLSGKLGGFHFNDSKYADDDLTSGSLKPYQLFLIFNELLDQKLNDESQQQDLGWMIDASHNLKDPLEDLLQSIEAINTGMAKALLIDRKKLYEAQESNDVAVSQEILQDAFQIDVRPLLRQLRYESEGAIFPLKSYRELSVRNGLIKKRGAKSISTGL
ncbi:MAG: TIM barrel protein [Bacteroidota bacterium]